MKRLTLYLSILVVLLVGWVLTLTVYAQPPEPVPVDQMTQCQAFNEQLVEDRYHAQMKVAYFAARTKDLTEQNQVLADKVKALEAKEKASGQAKDPH